MLRVIVLALPFVVAGVGTSQATPVIENSCRATSGQVSGNLCVCLQDVANYLLVPQDQNRVAKFIYNPDLVQEQKISDGGTNDGFWQRYENFANVATKACIGV